MIKDSKAEELEGKGLYRRASTRWQQVMIICTEEGERELIIQRIYMCLMNAKRPPVKT
ncbi:PerC family transcriptional regulator [Klebsiella pneumoniae]|nr:PerC family transcriptional regulator [Klebsiella pneumoniae]